MAITQEKGKFAEDLACDYLKKQGMKLVTRNFNSRYGEIDLIMRDKDNLVFVEVRYRKHSSFVDGATSVTFSKQKKLIRTAEYYLQNSGATIDTYARFDIISITHKQNKPAIDWLVNAFSA